MPGGTGAKGGRGAETRRLAPRRTLAANGFEALSAPLAGPGIDFLDHEAVVRKYYPQCAELVREASGARFAAAFDHNVRSAAGKRSKRRIEGGQQVQGPAHVVHGDYTLTSAPQRPRDLIGAGRLQRVVGRDQSDQARHRLRAETRAAQIRRAVGVSGS